MNLDHYGKCPVCSASWDGGDIPEHIREHYSPPYKWSRLIGIETTSYDGVSYWECPDCHSIWNRFSNELIHGPDRS
jgi:rubredoxin